MPPPLQVQSLSKQLHAKLPAGLLITGHFRTKLFKPSDSSDFVHQYNVNSQYFYIFFFVEMLFSVEIKNFDKLRGKFLLEIKRKTLNKTNSLSAS